MYGPVINCYRAILAQVNQLDSIFKPKTYVKELYMELTELAYYLMESDDYGAYKAVEQLYDTMKEVNYYAVFNQEKRESIEIMTCEINTHLDYLAVELLDKPSRVTNL